MTNDMSCTLLALNNKHDTWYVTNYYLNNKYRHITWVIDYYLNDKHDTIWVVD